MYNIQRCLTFGVCILYLVSCKIPKNTIIFSNGNEFFKGNKYRLIPSEWDGRLLAVGQVFELGGDVQHQHGILHEHIDTSDGASLTVRPLGLSKPTSSGEHNHYISSNQQSTEFSSFEKYEPKAKELNAYITKHSLSKIPNGLIVMYIGKDIPKGWQICNGTNNTPDLSSIYIRIKQKDCALAPVGNNAHVHDINHTHKWVMLPPDLDNNLNKALAVDEITYEGDTVTLNVFSHIHNIQEDPMINTKTIANDIFPPSIFIGFIQAINSPKRMPKNVVLPTLKTFYPIGWSPWIPANSNENKYIFGSINSDNYLKYFGSRNHSHSYLHTHKLTLTPIPGSRLFTSKGNGPVVSRSAHTHNVFATKKLETDSSSSLPLFVSFSFIIKK